MTSGDCCPARVRPQLTPRSAALPCFRSASCCWTARKRPLPARNERVLSRAALLSYRPSTRRGSRETCMCAPCGRTSCRPERGSHPSATLRRVYRETGRSVACEVQTVATDAATTSGCHAICAELLQDRCARLARGSLSPRGVRHCAGCHGETGRCVAGEVQAALRPLRPRAVVTQFARNCCKTVARGSFLRLGLLRRRLQHVLDVALGRGKTKPRLYLPADA